MDLLSLVGQSTKRKGDFFLQAESLALKCRTLPNLEKRMIEESKSLVRALKDKEIRWEEYSRSLVEKTLISALSAVRLGSKSKLKMEQAWPTIAGEMLPHLVKFLDQTKNRIDNNILLVGDDTVSFSDFSLEDEDSLEEPSERAAGKTWLGLVSRVIRYTATPTYSFYALGDQMVKRDQGFKECRRVAVSDKRTCNDCKLFARIGWQPIGELPLPGKQCRCFDRCRCRLEYR